MQVSIRLKGRQNDLFRVFFLSEYAKISDYRHALQKNLFKKITSN